jgi:hypothetical protein
VVPHAIAVLHGSGEDVSDRFNAAMGVPGETSQVVLGDIVAEVIEEKKWVELGRVSEAECAAQAHARTFNGRLRYDELLDWSNGHRASRKKRLVCSTQCYACLLLWRTWAAGNRLREWELTTGSPHQPYIAPMLKPAA